MVEQRTLDEIKNSIYGKNWGLYLIDNDHQDIASMVPRGPIEKITVDDKYLILPGVKRKSVDQMKRSLDVMVSTNNLPILRVPVLGIELGLTLTTFREDFVFVEEGNDHWMRYEAFIEALKTLPMCNLDRYS